MPSAQLLAAYLLGAAGAAASHQSFSDSIAETLFEGDALGLLQTTHSTVHTRTLEGNVTSWEVPRTAGKANASLIGAEGVANATMAAPSVINALKGELSMASMVMLNRTLDKNDEGLREIEMHGIPIGLPTKSKVALVVISMLGLGCLGIDRCYMGATCCGICKGITLGGLGIWEVVDWIAILINALEKDDTINAVGYKAQFHEEGVDTAFWISAIMLLLPLVGCLCTCCCFSLGFGATVAARATRAGALLKT